MSVFIAKEGALANSNNWLWLSLTFFVGMILGSILGAVCSKVCRNIPRVVGVGTLLYTPFLFGFWNFLDNGYGAEEWFVTGLCLLAVAALGFGAAYGGTLAYLGKSYSTSQNKNTGKVVGTYLWWIPLCLVLMQLILYLLGVRLVWGIVVASVVVVVALLWFFTMPTVLP
jgi:hypothetical protein